MRAAAPSTLGALLMLIAAGCSQQAEEAAVVVDFLLRGEGAAGAVDIVVRLRCADDHEKVEEILRPLADVAEGETPSLVITPGDPSCPIELAAQVLDEDRWVLAAAEITLDIAPDRVERRELLLDTDSCFTLDGDPGYYGHNGEQGCPTSRDCDELDETVYEGALERCDGLDNDCNGIIDDLGDDVLQEECLAQGLLWNPGVGLCAYWRPWCADGQIHCPELGEDDCAFWMDADCDDVLSGCGDDCERMVEGYECQDDCHLPRCDDAGNIRCAQRPGDPTLGEPCGDDPCYEYQCRGAEVHCLPTDLLYLPYEICDDGVDNDCDGFVDDDDQECSNPDVQEFECDPLFLPEGSSDPTEMTFCGFEQTYDLERCQFYSADGGVFDLGRLTLHFGVNAEVIDITQHELLGCCDCRLSLRSSTDEGRWLQIMRPGGELRLEVSGGEIEITIDRRFGPGGGGQDVRVFVPIVEGDAEGPYGPCSTECWPRLWIDEGGG